MDPSGQEANPYAYGVGNPINASDPSGLRSRFQIAVDILEAILDGQSILQAVGGLTSAEALGVGYGFFFGLYCIPIVGGVAFATTGPGAALVVGLGCTALTIAVSNAFTQLYDVG